MITPNEFAISQNYPNPFNPTTVISFSLPVAGLVNLEVFNINGRNVGSAQDRPLRDGWMEAGQHNITFDGSDLPSGIYFARMTAEDYTQTQKLVLLK
ncbi:hypothetical protein CEE37_05340 [candidate division LCP-89 bacterium B3_LCP]|uniref:Secretion system C-terminal sorting domain-containing protein n=1 Tax=candidate division LCP-89 bacterium B3_LCP TaxID=2012998 RepID=A0A532V1T4_UNCL8|nr:MAG: hypothetical protein CEE37_05340 [candidate division LCP-89 bacterium B3_LCP]